MKQIDDRFEKVTCWALRGCSDTMDDVRRMLVLTLANELIKSGVVIEDKPYGAIDMYGIVIYAKRTIKSKAEAERGAEWAER